MTYERMSAQDAALLAAQDPASPLQIGAVARFDGASLLRGGKGLDLERLRRHVEDRLEKLPRFHQHLVPVPFDQGPPVWVDDPDFDIAYHVNAVSLPRPGTDRELRALVADLLEEPLDMERPLWELWFVHGPVRPDGTVEGDQVATILKASHVMADGLGLLSFAWVVLDAEGEPPVEEAGSVSTPAPRPDGRSRPAPGRLWLETLVARARHGVGVAGRLAARTLRPLEAVSDGIDLARGAAALALPAPALSITRPVGSSRDFAWLRLPLHDLQEVAATHDVTLNDVVLSIVGGALEEYDGPPPRGGRTGPRVLIPVSTHEPDDLLNLGNRFTMMVTNLPGAGLDPVRRLKAVHGAVLRTKSSGQRSVAPVLFDAAELVPPWLLRRAGPGLIRHQPFVNLAVTNMPGSATPLYLLGAPMTELYPFITVTGNIGVIVGVLSYVDTLGLSVTVDADVVPDLDRLVAALRAAADSLVDANHAAARASGQP